MVYFTYIWLIFLVNVNIPYQGHPNTSLEDTTRPKNKPKHLLGCTWMSIGNCKYTIWPNLYYSPTQISPENFRGFLNLTMQILSIGVWMGHFFAWSSVDPQGRLPGNSPEFGRFDSTIKISDCPWNRFPPFPPPPQKKNRSQGLSNVPITSASQTHKHMFSYEKNPESWYGICKDISMEVSRHVSIHCLGSRRWTFESQVPEVSRHLPLSLHANLFSKENVMMERCVGCIQVPSHLR